MAGNFYLQLFCRTLTINELLKDAKKFQKTPNELMYAENGKTLIISRVKIKHSHLLEKHIFKH